MHKRLIQILLFAALPAMSAEKPFAFGTVRFEQNRGQAAPNVRYLARARGQQVFLTDTGVVFSPASGASVHMQFAGAGKSHWEGEGQAVDTISYYIGNDPSKWVKQAPVFEGVVWRNVYAGIDLRFRGSGDRLEYDVILAAGADPSQVRVQFDESVRPSLSADGSVAIAAGDNVIRQHLPEIWQDTPSGKRNIQGKFVTDGEHGLRLALEAYDRSQKLIVDPVLELSTYVGGENDDEIIAITDGAVAGNTRSVAFPGASPSVRGGRDVFIRGNGNVQTSLTQQPLLVGTAIIGGSGDDQLAGICSVTGGQPGYYLAGTTTSTDFPTTRGSTYNGGASDGFVVFFIATQRAAYLSDAFYVGGSGEDRINAIAGMGIAAAVVGVTDSPDLPASGMPQTSLAGGKDAFYRIVSSSYVVPPLYGYLGGSGDDAAYAVAAVNSTTIWIGGESSSSDFPSSDWALSGASDAFLARVTSPSFNSSNPQVAVTTDRLGGNGMDSVRALVGSPSSQGSPYPYIGVFATVDGVGFAGVTTSTDLPVLNAAQPQPGGDRDGFVGMLDRTTAAPRWLTYVGGSGPDEITAIAQNWAGDLYVGGWTGSRDLPVVNALQSTAAGGEDGLFAVFDYSGNLQHLTYFGGSGDDRIRGVGVLSNSVASVVGSTTSTDLPQQNPTQSRSNGMDGFIANIGSDYFIGPSSLVLAKDGVLTFAVRAARTVYRQPAIYQSSDPSRVRVVYVGRSFDQVTAAVDDNIAIEGLTDNGQADIIISAPGYATKTIHVSLYPGAFVPSQPIPAAISTWSTNPNFVYFAYSAIDPSTGLPIGSFEVVRAGAPSPVFNWSASDPTILALSPSQAYGGYLTLQTLAPGTTTLTLTVDGYSVIQGQKTVIVASPQLAPPTSDVHLGKDLAAALPITFTFHGVLAAAGFKGTLTARSADSSRLLLSLAADQPGLDHVSLTLSNVTPRIYAQALADDGAAQVFLSLGDSSGEIPMNVILEPAVVKWGVLLPGSGAFVLNPSPSLTLGFGSSTTALSFDLEGTSGASGTLRPGATPPVLTLSNSDPTIIELNRLTVIPGSNTNYTLLPIAAGSSTLKLASSNPSMPAVPDSLVVSVKPYAAALPTFAAEYRVGKNLQMAITFSYSILPSANPPTLAVVSDDPSSLLVSTNARTFGSVQISLPTNINSSQYTFYLQGLSDSTSTTVRVRFPEGERAFLVTLLPSGAGFYSIPITGSFPGGFNEQVQVTTYALDRSTHVGVSQQSPIPGAVISVHFKADSPVQLDRTSAVLTPDNVPLPVYFTVPATAAQATITVSTDANPSVSPLTSTVKVTAAGSITGPPAGTSIPEIDALLARGELQMVSLGQSYTQSVTVTSSDPQKVLVGAHSTDAGSTSIQLPANAFTIYLHALDDSGLVPVRLESGGVTVKVIQVALRPLQFNVINASYGAPLLPGASEDYTASLNASQLRPGVGPFHVTLESSNPAVATVAPAAFDIGGGATFAGKLTVTGVSPGTTQVTIEGPPELAPVPSTVPVTVLSSSASPLPSYTLGMNLQGSLQVDLGANFSNPNGAIVTLSSSDPSVFLLSRAASTQGSTSVVIAVPAPGHVTQPVYLQGIAQGTATIQVTANGATSAVATVQIVPSWVSCGNQPISMTVGTGQAVSCGFRYNAGTAYQPFDSISARAGLSNLTLNLTSSAPDVFTVSPSSINLSNTFGVSVQAVSAGTGALQLTDPPGFGPSPDGSEALAVTVVPPALHLLCGPESAMGRDTQINCGPGNVSVAVTATSSDPSLLLVSSNPNLAGARVATLPAGTDAGFVLQALAGSGTAEVVFSAPGYLDTRVAVALRPSAINLGLQPYSSTTTTAPLSLRVGNTDTVYVSMSLAGYQATPRAGANLAVDLSTDQPAIATITPSRIVLNGPQPTGAAQVQVQAKAAGSTLLRMSVPPGYVATGTPLTVSILP